MSSELIVAIFLTTTLVSTGLLGVWAGTSTRHWFVRFAVSIAVLSPLVWADGHELFLLLFFQIVLVALSVDQLGRFRDRSDVATSGAGRVRFSLLTTLLATVVFAILSAITMRSENMRPAILLALAVGASICAVPVVLGWVVGIAVTRRQMRPRVCLIIGGIATSVVMIWFFNRNQPEIWITLSASFILTVMFVKLLGFTPEQEQRTRRSAPIRVLTWAMLLAITCPPIYALWHLVKPAVYVPQAETDPNHYDELLAIGRAIGKSSPQQLPVELNRLRHVITKSVYVPVDFKKDFVGGDELGEIRQMARALDAQGDAEILRQDPDAAADWFLDTVRFGVVTRRGGLLVHGLTGVACTGVGTKAIFEHRRLFSLRKREAMSQKILELADAAESFDEFKRREIGWMQGVHGWVGRLWLMVEKIAAVTSMDCGLDSTRLAFVNEQGTLRLLATELAISAYSLESGKLPESLPELVPEYLSSVPVDPFDPDGSQIRYVPRDDGIFRVYSVGPNRVGDGGQPPPIDSPQVYPGDLVLDAIFLDDTIAP